MMCSKIVDEKSTQKECCRSRSENRTRRSSYDRQIGAPVTADTCCIIHINLQDHLWLKFSALLMNMNYTLLLKNLNNLPPP